MTTAVLIVGLVNLGLGFAIAVWANGSLVLLLPTIRAKTRPDRETPPDSTAEDSANPMPSDGMPAEWTSTLGEHGVRPESVAEALLWLVRTQLPTVRDSILDIDAAVREPASPAPTCEALEGWTQQLEERTKLMLQTAVSSDSAPDPAEVEDALMDHTSQLRSARDLLMTAHKNGAREEAVRQSCQLVASCDRLLHRVDDLLSSTLRGDGRLAALPHKFQCFSEGAYTRLGMEVIFHQWLTDDPDRLRLVSGVLVDVDRTDKLNEQYGARAIDAALPALQSELRSRLRRSRGFDRVSRAGARFFLFLGDTGLGNAAKAADRIRQTIEATTFRIGDETIELTISNAVAELGSDETASPLLGRLQQGVAEAKKLGRNRTCIDAGDGPAPAETLQYKVTGQVIEVE